MLGQELKLHKSGGEPVISLQEQSEGECVDTVLDKFKNRSRVQWQVQLPCPFKLTPSKINTQTPEPHIPNDYPLEESYSVEDHDSGGMKNFGARDLDKSTRPLISKSSSNNWLTWEQVAKCSNTPAQDNQSDKNIGISMPKLEAAKALTPSVQKLNLLAHYVVPSLFKRLRGSPGKVKDQEDRNVEDKDYVILGIEVSV